MMAFDLELSADPGSISAATTVTIHMIFDEAQFRLAEIRGCSNVAEE